MGLKDIEDYGLVPKDLFLNWDWYRIGYDENDKAKHFAKFSKKGPGIIMTNTSNDKDGIVYFFDLKDAESFLENIKQGKSKALYEFEIKNVQDRVVRRLIGNCSQAAVCQLNTKYGSAYQVYPLKDNYIPTSSEKDIIYGGEQFLKRNNMKGFVDYLLKAKWCDFNTRCNIFSFMYAQGIDAFSYLV